MTDSPWDRARLPEGRVQHLSPVDRTVSPSLSLVWIPIVQSRPTRLRSLVLQEDGVVARLAEVVAAAESEIVLVAEVIEDVASLEEVVGAALGRPKCPPLTLVSAAPLETSLLTLRRAREERSLDARLVAVLAVAPATVGRAGVAVVAAASRRAEAVLVASFVVLLE